MSATQGSGEQWQSLESLGISRKELVLAEALQMEYDALSRLRQDKGHHEEGRGKQNTEQALISWDDPVLEYNPVKTNCKGMKITRGLSGSDPTLNYNSMLEDSGLLCKVGSTSLRLSDPPPQSWVKEPPNDYMYIFDGPGEKSISGEKSAPVDGSCFLEKDLPKKLTPPPLPPRTSMLGSSEIKLSPPPRRSSPKPYKGSQSKDINVYSSEYNGSTGKLLDRRISEEEDLPPVNYDGINDAIMRLNLKSTYDAELLKQATRSWKDGKIIFEKETSGKPVARSKTLPPQVPPRTYTPRSANQKNVVPSKNRRVSVDPGILRAPCVSNGYELFEVSEERDEEVAAFCHMLDGLRADHSSRDFISTGFVWSPVNLSAEHLGLGVSLKVTVVCDSLPEPLTFTCDCSSTVDLLIYQTLCYTNDELHAIDVNDYVLKLCGLEEFLQNERVLGSHEYIQQCRKFDIDIRLQLMKRRDVRGDLARTASDHQSPWTLNHHVHLQERPVKQTISRQAMSLLFDNFHNEVDDFLAAEVDHQHKAERVVQSVMVVCNALAAVETQEVTSALNQLPTCSSRIQHKGPKDPNALASRETREKVVEAVTAAVLDLVQLYCSAFNADFQALVHGGRKQYVTQEASLLTSPLAFTIYAAHRIPISWVASYEEFYVCCSLSHGSRELCSQLQTKKVQVSKSLFHLILWDHM